MPCYTHKMAIVYRGRGFCDVTSPYVLGYIDPAPGHREQAERACQ